jgi:ubiquitin carboxyl-terminal hydrolase 14
MNATVQCLKRVDELKNALKSYSDQSSGFEANVLLTKAAKQLFTNLDSKGEPFAPSQFVQIMRMAFPQFNETDDHGHHKQQDADECYSSLLSSFKQTLKLEDDVAPDLVDKLFGVELETTLTNKETDAEPPSSTTENVLKLSCHIDNNNKPIDHLSEGLKISLEGEIQKHSQVLGRDAVFSKTSKINRLVTHLILIPL